MVREYLAAVEAFDGGALGAPCRASIRVDNTRAALVAALEKLSKVSKKLKSEMKEREALDKEAGVLRDKVENGEKYFNEKLDKQQGMVNFWANGGLVEQ